jgi:putative DNA primase/helicase
MSNSFHDFIRSHGFETKSEIYAGQFFRVGRKNSVSVKLFEDGLAGYLHNWRTGERFFWFSNPSPSSKYTKRTQESEALKQIQNAKRMLAYLKASKRAQEFFEGASQASDSHPYLARKKVKAYGLKAKGGDLLIPVYSVSGNFQSIQFIDKNGVKRFLKGGQMSGGCHFIGEIRRSKPVYICEGYATSASVYEDTQCLTIVAFNAGNLVNVATGIRKKFPDVQIVIAGDSDAVGKRYAEKASKAVNGLALIPDFGKNPQGFSDWNDYFNCEAKA